jgi:hypothetical protein
MNGKRTKQLREQVFTELKYEPTLDDPKSKIMKDPDFKSVFRAKKKNHLRNVVEPKIKTSRRQIRIGNLFITKSTINKKGRRNKPQRRKLKA